MFIELTHNNYHASRDEVFDYYNFAMNSNTSLLSIFPFNAQYFSDLSKISIMVDYPYGMGSVGSRCAEVKHACELGAKAIDIVVNHHLLNAEEYGQIINELNSYTKICKSYGVIVRLVLEYKLIEEKYIKNLALLLKNAGVEYMITSTTIYVGDYVDNLIIGERIASSGVKSICASAMWLERHLNIFPTTKNYAIKTNSLNFIKKYQNMVYNNIGTDKQVLEEIN